MISIGNTAGQKRGAVRGEWPLHKAELALYYRVVGRLGQAHLVQQAQDALDVEQGPYLWHSIVAKYTEGQYEEVIQGARQVQRAEPESHIGFMLEAWGQIGRRDFPAARHAVQRGLSLHERQDLRALLGYIYARMNEREKATEVVRDLGQLPYAQPYCVARIHAA